MRETAAISRLSFGSIKAMALPSALSPVSLKLFVKILVVYTGMPSNQINLFSALYNFESNLPRMAIEIRCDFGGIEGAQKPILINVRNAFNASRLLDGYINFRKFIRKSEWSAKIRRSGLSAFSIVTYLDLPPLFSRGWIIR